MTTLYNEYLKKRYYNVMPHYINTAKNALLSIRSEQSLKAWKESIEAPNEFYTDSDNIAHTYTTNDGYTLTFKIECDDICRADDVRHQGYSVETNCNRHCKPDFADHGEFTRHTGKGLQAFIDIGERCINYASFDIPESYIEQFYSHKNYSKHNAYINMIASARMAIQQDIKNYYHTEYFYISVTVEKDGVELESFGICGIDESYAISGQAFFDYSYSDAMEFIKNDREKAACEYANYMTASRPDFYELNTQ